MNNKYAFFLLGDVSILLFTAAEAFSTFVSPSLTLLIQSGTDCCSLYPKLFGG